MNQTPDFKEEVPVNNLSPLPPKYMAANNNVLYVQPQKKGNWGPAIIFIAIFLLATVGFVSLVSSLSSDGSDNANTSTTNSNWGDLFGGRGGDDTYGYNRDDAPSTSTNLVEVTYKITSKNNSSVSLVTYSTNDENLGMKILHSVKTPWTLKTKVSSLSAAKLSAMSFNDDEFTCAIYAGNDTKPIKTNTSGFAINC